MKARTKLIPAIILAASLPLTFTASAQDPSTGMSSPQQGAMPMMRGMPMMQGGQGGMPMMGPGTGGQRMGMMGGPCAHQGSGQQGKMDRMQMMQERRAMMQAHMQKMENHMANIERLLEELVAQQKQ
jgi:hypothetical protein